MRLFGCGVGCTLMRHGRVRRCARTHPNCTRALWDALHRAQPYHIQCTKMTKNIINLLDTYVTAHPTKVVKSYSRGRLLVHIRVNYRQSISLARLNYTLTTGNLHLHDVHDICAPNPRLSRLINRSRNIYLSYEEE